MAASSPDWGLNLAAVENVRVRAIRAAIERRIAGEIMNFSAIGLSRRMPEAEGGTIVTTPLRPLRGFVASLSLRLRRLMCGRALPSRMAVDVLRATPFFESFSASSSASGGGAAPHQERHR